MNIVVCVKQVPDTEVERSLVPGDNTVDRASVDGVINYLDEYAIEEGPEDRRGAGRRGHHLVDGPGEGGESIRKALSMGADKAVHVIDDALAGSDALETSLRAGRGAQGGRASTW
jgi:electron transfer flavoprotein beta subunit